MNHFNFDQQPQGDSGRNYTSYDSILQPQLILPTQLRGDRRKAAESLRRLMAAILEDAFKCFQKNINAQHLSQRREFFEAKHWFFGSNADGPFAFENVCHILDLDPDHIRYMLRNWDPRKTTSRGQSSGDLGDRPTRDRRLQNLKSDKKAKELVTG